MSIEESKFIVQCLQLESGAPKQCGRGFLKPLVLGFEVSCITH